MPDDRGEADQLAVDPETMRRLGHEVVDRLVEREAGSRAEPVIKRLIGASVAARAARL